MDMDVGRRHRATALAAEAAAANGVLSLGLCSPRAAFFGSPGSEQKYMPRQQSPKSTMATKIEMAPYRTALPPALRHSASHAL